MTLAEKQSRQKEIIDSLFASVKRKPFNRKKCISFFEEKLTQIFELELEYYNLYYSRTSKELNDANISFEDKAPEETTLATLFTGGTYKDKENRFIPDIPEVVMYRGRIYKYLFYLDRDARYEGCRELIADLFHELRHLRQYYLTLSGISNYEILKFGREKAVTCNKSFNAIYRLNHNEFFTESDANATSYQNENEMNYKHKIDDSVVRYTKLIRESSFFLVPHEGIVERDDFIDSLIEKVIINQKETIYLHYMPILFKEYNIECSPIRFSDLISNYEREIREVESQKISEDDKRKFITDIKEMYFELFNKKVRKGNTFEFYQAVNVHGKEKVRSLLNEMLLYNAKEKNRKSDAVKEKLKEDEEKLNGLEKYRYGNRGVIANPLCNFKDVIDASDLIEKLDLNVNNISILLYLNSKEFQDKLPVYGYYTLKNGSKMSIKDFIEKFLVRVLAKVKPRDYKYALDVCCMTICMPSHEMSASYHFEMINKKYQDQTNRINEYLNHPFLSNSMEAIRSSYDPDLIEKMDLVCGMVNDDNGAFHRFEAYLQVKGYNYHLEILDAALKLNKDKTFNPDHRDYYNLLLTDTTFIEILNKMEPNDCKNDEIVP